MRFITCRLPDGVEDPAILSEDGRQVWPLSWLGLSYETLSEAIPFLTPQVRYGLSLAIAGIPALPVEAVTLESPIPAPAQDVICLGINYMAHSDEAEKYSAAAFATKHEDAIYFSKRVTHLTHSHSNNFSLYATPNSFYILLSNLTFSRT